MERVIIDGGKSRYHIVTSRVPHDAEIYAASVLYEYLYKATGVLVPMFSDVIRCPKRSPEILIGSGVRGITADTGDIKDDGFVIKTAGEDIIIAGKTPRGTVYGVYSFLERYIGFKCFTKDVETFDCLDRIAVEDISISSEPAFEYREVYFRQAFDPDFCIKNGLNSNLAPIPAEKGGKLKFFNFHHSFNELVPPEEYYDEHPEYFSLADGKRLKEDTQLCLSNGDVFKIARRTLRKWITENPTCKVFSVAQNDWLNYCTCENCRRLDDRYGTPAASVIDFVNRLAYDIKDEFPDVLLHTFAYQYTKKAPIGMKVADNVIVRLCNIECSWGMPMDKQAALDPASDAAGFVKNISDWGAMSRHLYIWDYACNFSNYLLPFPNYRTMPRNLRLYKTYNVAGVLQQGNFSYGEAAGLADLESYLAARLLWDPNRDENRLIDEFLIGVYGRECYPFMKEYVDMLCEAVDGRRLRLYQNTDADYITDELVKRAEELFSEALSVVKSEKSRWYLRKEYLTVLFMKAARMPLCDPERSRLIDLLYSGVKEFGITEIRERRPFDISFDNLRNSQYGTARDNEYVLYYIMK